LQKYKAVIVDVEMAFLHGVLKKGEEIYMDCPQRDGTSRRQMFVT
jgi:hypothetical protein